MLRKENTTIQVLFFLVIIALSSCNSNDTVPEPNIYHAYSFFVAGHSYGMPGVNNQGLHPPFEAKFDFINSRMIELGVLTGDIVKESTSKDWDEVDSVLLNLDAEIYFAPGNHDLKDRELYESRYGKTYFTFRKNKDMFIFLDPNLDQWNISGEQLLFLEETLHNGTDARNIFVFMHQLLWWDQHNKYRFVRINSIEGRADTLNFWSTIVPLFKATNKHIVMFAGDIGAASWSDNYMYDFDEENDITFIASGMGDEDGDNFIITNVSADGAIEFELIAINGDDINALGKLEDYVLPTREPSMIGRAFSKETSISD